MSRPFVALDPAWWPAITERLEASGEPWPREAVCMDLRWWEDQERVGWARRPGRPTLAKRWGWSERQVRTILDERGTWMDPFRRPASGQSAASERPAGGQDRTRKGKDERDRWSSARPAAVQEAASDRPARGGDTPFAGHRSTTTPTHGGSPPAPRPDAASGVLNPVEVQARATWDEEYAKSRWGSDPYPWDLGHRGSDHRRLARWMEVARNAERLRSAIHAYLTAVEAGESWPKGDPPTTRRFTDEIAKWVQVGDKPVVIRFPASTPSSRPRSIAERLAGRDSPVVRQAASPFSHPTPGTKP